MLRCVLAASMVALSSTPVMAQPAPEPPSPAPSTPSKAAASLPTQEVDDDFHRWHFELAFFPMLLEQQIEGPNRDDKLTQDATLSTALSISYAPLEWIEPALWLQLDAGNVRRATFTRPDATGATSEDQLVEGSFWELWVAFMARGRLGPGFVELGWAPLMLRQDTVRDDLPNVNGETDGVFEGSRSVAFILGGGASLPVWDYLDITLRLQFRIRYLVARGGEPLADEEENGQMALWPYFGAHWHF
jgi:hypothetical protein